MNKVHAAYQKLGVAPGTSLDVAKQRYRQLAMVWHPDRMPTPDGKRTAEEELKQINNAFDCIKKHFESEHRQGPGCECQPAAVHREQTGSGQNHNAGNAHPTGDDQTGRSQGYSNPGGSQREKTAYEKWSEQEASAEAERRRRAEETQEEALKEALEEARQAAAAQAAAAAKATAKTSNPPLTDDQIRWKVAAAFAVIFVFLLIGGFNRRHEPSATPKSDSSTAEHLMPCPFVN
ncbi:DnaJ domain-containing protein [Patescibacteria group bacterium]|nr:DnaJ domain-containing protein [Patescibacteria group bacterium]